VYPHCVFLCFNEEYVGGGNGFLPGNSVMSPGDEIVPVWGEVRVPHRVVVTFVAHQTGKRLETPQPDGAVFRTR